MKIFSRNEYSRLKSVLVGDATGARFPALDEIFDYNQEITLWKESTLPKGRFPQFVIDQANEDLSVLVRTFKELGISVYRPNEIDHSHIVRTHQWETDGMHSYCPRDTLLIIDDMVIECPMIYRSRQFEAFAYQKVRRRAIADNVRWISAPRPVLLTQDTYVSDKKLVLNEREPMFDASNILRNNDDIFYLISNTGNKVGAQWLSNLLGKQYKVHLLENLNIFSHIDNSICILRDGLVLLNSSKINNTNCPDYFQKWNKIYFDQIQDKEFWKYPYSSKWIGMNILSIDPNTVIIDKYQTQLIKQLKKYKIDSIPLELRHSRTLGGGFHSVALDLNREH